MDSPPINYKLWGKHKPCGWKEVAQQLSRCVGNTSKQHQSSSKAISRHVRPKPDWNQTQITGTTSGGVTRGGVEVSRRTRNLTVARSLPLNQKPATHAMIGSCKCWVAKPQRLRLKSFWSLRLRPQSSLWHIILKRKKILKILQWSSRRYLTH